jgi:hypothetical protein
VTVSVLSGDGVLVARITKNRRETVAVALREFKGYTFCDIRVNYLEGGQDRPTVKGIALAPARLSELIAALQRAEVEARRLGLLP